MRTALLQTPGDPATLTYWLRNFETWRDEVDELVVLINNLYYPDFMAYDERVIKEHGGRTLWYEGRVQHGDCIDILLHQASDLVVLCEDDAYVRTPGSVRAAFDRIETGQTDVIGSPRYQDTLSNKIEGSWGPLTQDFSEIERVLWPTFLFARASDLLATNRRFGYDTWNIGDTVAGLDLEVTPELCRYVGTGDYLGLDVFYGTTYQLRKAGLRIEHVNRVRVLNVDATEQWVKNDPPWVHVTEISTFLGAVMPLLPNTEAIPIDDVPDIKPGGGRWTRCIAWWERMGRLETDIPGYTEQRQGWIDRFGALADVDRSEVARWQERIDPWITWAEVPVPA